MVHAETKKPDTGGMLWVHGVNQLFMAPWAENPRCLASLNSLGKRYIYTIIQSVNIYIYIIVNIVNYLTIYMEPVCC